MITRVRLCLLYDLLKWDFIAFKINIISIRKHNVDTDVVNDVTCTRQSVITRMVLRSLWHDVINWITGTSYDIEDIWLFQCKIDFYFTEWTPKVVFSRVAEPRVKILLLVFMSEIKIDLTLKKSNFLFLLCFKNAIIKFIPMRQLSRQRNSFFSSRFTSNLMLPAYLLGLILVANAVCFATQKSLEISLR